MLASWSPAQVEAMRWGAERNAARKAAGIPFEVVAEEDRCVNFGEAHCLGRSEANGWCTGCWERLG